MLFESFGAPQPQPLGGETPQPGRGEAGAAAVPARPPRGRRAGAGPSRATPGRAGPPPAAARGKAAAAGP